MNIYKRYLQSSDNSCGLKLAMYMDRKNNYDITHQN